MTSSSGRLHLFDPLMDNVQEGRLLRFDVLQVIERRGTPVLGVPLQEAARIRNLRLRRVVLHLGALVKDDVDKIGTNAGGREILLEMKARSIPLDPFANLGIRAEDDFP